MKRLLRKLHRLFLIGREGFDLESNSRHLEVSGLHVDNGLQIDSILVPVILQTGQSNNKVYYRRTSLRSGMLM